MNKIETAPIPDPKDEQPEQSSLWMHKPSKAVYIAARAPQLILVSLSRGQRYSDSGPFGTDREEFIPWTHPVTITPKA